MFYEYDRFGTDPSGVGCLFSWSTDSVVSFTLTNSSGPDLSESVSLRESSISADSMGTLSSFSSPQFMLSSFHLARVGHTCDMGMIVLKHFNRRQKTNDGIDLTALN